MSAAPAVEKNLFHMLLEIERHFRAEERKDLGLKRGRSHLNFVRIIKKPSENTPKSLTAPWDLITTTSGRKLCGQSGSSSCNLVLGSFKT